MAWWIPILIFFARICDVSIGTVRMIFVINGHRWLAACLGFFEVSIWALAVGGMVTHLTEWTPIVAYAAGFATGTLVGMTIEDRIAVGYRTVRVINAEPSIHVSESLREKGYRVTRVDARGGRGPVELAFLVVRRRAMPDTLELINEIAPEAFISIERTDRASGECFKSVRSARAGMWLRGAALRK